MPACQPRGDAAKVLKPMKIVSVAAFALMVLGIALLATRHELFSPSPFVIAAQVGAVALMIWARVTFGGRSFHPAANPTAGGLVTTGPYRFVRHPIYTAACLFTAAGVAAHPSWTAIGLGALVFAGGIVRMLSEERLLVAKYPEYVAYAGTTKRMIPFVF